MIRSFVTPFLNTARAIAAFGAMCLVPLVQAQDFTQMDITGMYNAWAQGQQMEMQAMQQQIIQQNMNDPNVIALYNQQVAAGLFQGDLASFAYKYAATGGMSAQGYANYNNTTNQIAEQYRGAYNDYNEGLQNYRDAYSGYTGGYATNAAEAGRGLMGQSTYQGYGNGQVLPHTWQPNSYNTYNGNSYYVDEGGRYYMADPNGSGVWYPLQR